MRPTRGGRSAPWPELRRLARGVSGITYLLPKREVSHQATGTEAGSRSWDSWMGRSSSGTYLSGYTASSSIPGTLSGRHAWDGRRSGSGRSRRSTRRWWVGWVRRADGHGREVRGVSRELMEQYSSRRRSIDALTERLARRFEAQHGYAPDAHALEKLRQWANHQSRRAKPGGPLDLDAAVRRWVAQARAGEAGALGPIMPRVTSRSGRGAATDAGPRPIWELTEEQALDVIGQALARAQDAQPTWRKADLLRHRGELLPDDVACRDDKTAAALLERLADRVLAGGTGERVLCLEAPEWPPVPAALRRADGRSVYRPHSGIRYATLAQLTLEERLTAQAQGSGAPRLEPELAAFLLGADQARLEAQLRDAAQTAQAARETTGSGLRLDQAAAAFVALVSDRRAEILVGPAGSGKTRTAAEVAPALLNKALALDEQERPEEALPAAEQAAGLYAELAQADPQAFDPDLESARRQVTRIKAHVATALVSKAVALARQEQLGQALASYDQLIGQFTDDPQPAQRHLVAAALINKGGLLVKRGHRGGALASYNLLIKRYLDDEYAAICALVAKAVARKRAILGS